MAQIVNSSEECTCKDEVRVYKDEGEEDEEKNRSSENLSEDKVNLVTEGEDQKPLNFSDIFRPSYENVFQVPFADYFFPPYPGSYASAFTPESSFTPKVPFVPSGPASFGFMPFSMRDAMESCGLNGPLGFPQTYPFQPRNGFMFGPHISALCSENLANMWASSNSPPFPLLSPFMSAVISSTPATNSSNSADTTLAGCNTPKLTTISSPIPTTSKELTYLNGIMHTPSPLRPTPINLSSYSPLSLKSSPATKDNTNFMASTSANVNTERKWNETATSNDVYSGFQFLSNISVTSSTAPSTPSVNGKYEKAFAFTNKETDGNHGVNGDDKFCKSTHHKESQKPHIKKPLNAFMLFMKEMRQKVQEECTLKESAAINQILGKKWHTLSREEQSKYYEIAKKEKQLHIQLFPDWSARDNYAIHSKHKKKRRLGQGGFSDNSDCKGNDSNSMKKCRARYGIEQMSQWCKPCRRKKKCIRFLRTDDSKPDCHPKDSSHCTFQSPQDKSLFDMDTSVDEDTMYLDPTTQPNGTPPPSPQGPFLHDYDQPLPKTISASQQLFTTKITAVKSSVKRPNKISPESSCASANTISELSSNPIPSPSSAFSSLKSPLNSEKVQTTSRLVNQLTLLL